MLFSRQIDSVYGSLASNKNKSPRWLRIICRSRVATARTREISLSIERETSLLPRSRVKEERVTRETLPGGRNLIVSVSLQRQSYRRLEREMPLSDTRRSERNKYDTLQCNGAKDHDWIAENTTVSGIWRKLEIMIVSTVTIPASSTILSLRLTNLILQIFSKVCEKIVFRIKIVFSW